MRKLTGQRRPNPPGKILDRLTPMRMRVSYGPNRSIEEHLDIGTYTSHLNAYAWQCNRRRCVSAEVGGYANTLAAAQRDADQHARQHFGMRAVYEEG